MLSNMYDAHSQKQVFEFWGRSVSFNTDSDKAQGTSALKSLLPPLDLHGMKFEWISGIFDSILLIFAKIKVQVVSLAYYM